MQCHKKERTKIKPKEDRVKCPVICARIWREFILKDRRRAFSNTKTFGLTILDLARKKQKNNRITFKCHLEVLKFMMDAYFQVPCF
jgi:hypothetical protein